MNEVQKLLFGLSLDDVIKFRMYMLKRYKVYCNSMEELESAIMDYIPTSDLLDELYEVLA